MASTGLDRVELIGGLRKSSVGNSGVDARWEWADGSGVYSGCGMRKQIKTAVSGPLQT